MFLTERKYIVGKRQPALTQINQLILSSRAGKENLIGLYRLIIYGLTNFTDLYDECLSRNIIVDYDTWVRGLQEVH